eukprot:TRINITY_DN12131_c0_g1_i2.p1 TRINITY_DN12131_c0_g1~~TRINITY_DN12131_c0_g1_i2.p1  ORF type:complete len:328 (-),score=77.09 TRINITY_DN12131_c0_g1_i2:360-1265(-)
MFFFCCSGAQGAVAEHENAHSPGKSFVEPLQLEETATLPKAAEKLEPKQPQEKNATETVATAPEPEPAAVPEIAEQLKPEPTPSTVAPDPAILLADQKGVSPQEGKTDGLSGEMHFGYPIEMQVPMTVIVDNAGGGSAPGLICDVSTGKHCLVQIVTAMPGLIDKWNKTASDQNIVRKFDRVCKVSAKGQARGAQDLADALSSGGVLTIAMEHPGEMKVSVKKSGKKLGLKCKELEMKGLYIDSIGDGIIKEMNESGAINPPLKPYDVIFSINGKNKYGDEMLAQMESLEEFTMLVYSYKI